ncbi:helix-turn-helix domain containing protein [Desulfovibrio sp. OttesenSCG-928-A18]|nr:helix-turn-helix domain containing protein [Desulfovibrio sp. OttesenSCG-928-A18]
MKDGDERSHQLGVGEYEEVQFEEVLQRLFTATGTSSQMELAAWMGIRPSILSDAKRRNRVPVDWLRRLVLRKVDFSPLWIMTGKEPSHW